MGGSANGELDKWVLSNWAGGVGVSESAVDSGEKDWATE